MRLRSLARSFLLIMAMLGPAVLGPALMAPPSAQAQPVCAPSSPSLDPYGAFLQGEANYLSYTLPSNLIAPAAIAVNSADQFQYATVVETLAPLKLLFTQFNSVFPPTGTATLPRLFLADPLTISYFYLGVGPYSADQLQAVRQLYAIDLISRRNYALNVTNLARDLTMLRQVPTLSPLHLQLIDRGLAALRAAYTTLSNPALPAPDPRELYRALASIYSQLSMDEGIDIGYTRFTLSLNILAIGISNYDTNRVPVPGGNNTPTPTTCNGCFPFEDFDVARNRPLSAPQINPGGVFRANVEAFLSKLGLDRSDLSPDQASGAGFFAYQVNSADQLQFISAALARFPGSDLKVFFGPGFPTINAANLPRFAFASNADGYLRSADSVPATQRRLTTFYADPANAARRANYGTNLRNLVCAFRQLQQDPRLPAAASPAVQGALGTLTTALAVLDGGGLPDVLGTYQAINANVASIFATLPSGARNIFGSQATPIAILKTIDVSLMPIGVINYLFTPVLLLP